MRDRLEIKVCGMREPGNIYDVASLVPDYMGFIFYDLSPRCCRGILSPEVVAALPAGVVPVIVSVDMPAIGLETLAESLGITTLQLHGSETPEYCHGLRGKGFKVWKATRFSGREDMARLEGYVETVDRFVFDTPAPCYGGSGRKFDWRLLDSYALPVDFMLSGGIGENDVEAVKALHHTRLVGIDLNSRFEISPGVKDPTRLGRFMTRLFV